MRVLFQRPVEQGLDADGDLLRLLAEARDDGIPEPRVLAREDLVGVVGRAMDLGHEVVREHEPHDLPDRIGPDHPEDLQAARDLDRDRRLAHAGRASDEHEDGAPLLLRVPEHSVAVRGFGTVRTLARLAAEIPQLHAIDLLAPLPQQPRLQLARDVERVARVQTGAQERGHQDPLGEGAAPARPDHDDGGLAERMVERIELVAVREQLVDQLGEIAGPHAAAVGDAVTDRRCRVESDVEGHTTRHERLDEYAAHEWPRPFGTDHDEG